MQYKEYEAGASFDLKYRIRDLDGILGNKATVQFVDDLLRSNDFPKFTMLTGPPGSGKTTTAFIIARTLKCINGKGRVACGTCESCVGVEETLYTDGKGNSSLGIHTFDMGLNSDVEYVNNIAHSIQSGSAMGRKIMIIEELQRTKKDTQDTLLRSLEFIPDDVYVIVTTSEPYKIASAIKTRAIEIQFTYPDTSTLQEYMTEVVLAEEVRISKGELRELITHHNQNPRMILKSLSNIKASGRSGIDYLITLKSEENQKFLNYFQSVENGIISTIEFIDGLDGKAVFLHQMKYFIKDAIKMRYIVTTTDTKYRKSVLDTIGKYTDDELYQILDILTNIKYMTDNDAEVTLMTLAYKLNKMIYHEITQPDPVQQVHHTAAQREVELISETLKMSTGTVSVSDL